MPVESKEELSRLAHELADLDSEIEKNSNDIKSGNPVLKIFPNLLKVAMHNLRGTHLTDLGSESAVVYQQLLDGIAVVNQWIEVTLKMVRPEGVQTDNVVPLRPVNKTNANLPKEPLL